MTACARACHVEGRGGWVVVGGGASLWVADALGPAWCVARGRQLPGSTAPAGAGSSCCLTAAARSAATGPCPCARRWAWVGASAPPVRKDEGQHPRGHAEQGEEGGEGAGGKEGTRVRGRGRSTSTAQRALRPQRGHPHAGTPATAALAGTNTAPAHHPLPPHRATHCPTPCPSPSARGRLGATTAASYSHHPRLTASTLATSRLLRGLLLLTQPHIPPHPAPPQLPLAAPGSQPWERAPPSPSRPQPSAARPVWQQNWQREGR